MSRLLLTFASLLVAFGLVAGAGMVAPAAYAQDAQQQEPIQEDPAVQQPVVQDPDLQDDPDTLPATASPLPLIALLGAGFMAWGAITRRR